MQHGWTLAPRSLLPVTFTKSGSKSRSLCYYHPTANATWMLDACAENPFALRPAGPSMARPGNLLRQNPPGSAEVQLKSGCITFSHISAACGWNRSRQPHVSRT
eukprot:1142261-Pelagomonas_calceolata.AAC.11